MTNACRYRLDNDSSAALTLPDGRKLGYAQYGLLTGRAILYFHGLPGSRIEAAMFDTLAKDLGARIIAFDRPGGGWSSPHPERTILSHIKDVECLTDQLGLDAYGVLGISGGGPYALASAAALPAAKLKAVTIVCGLGPPDIGYAGMPLLSRIGFALAFPYLPGLMQRWVGIWPIAWPGARYDLTEEERLELWQKQIAEGKAKANPKDDVFHGDVDRLRLSLRSSGECFRHGGGAFAQDAQLSTWDFGFRIEDVRSDLPVRLWYGNEDINVPLNHGVQIAARLGSNACLRIEDETHASILMNREREILEDLLKTM